MDGVKHQDSTPQNDSTLGFKWIKKNLIGLWNIFHKKLMITSIAEFSHSNFESWRDIPYFKNNFTLDLFMSGERYRLIWASSLFWNDVSFVPVRVLHKDEKILGRKQFFSYIIRGFKVGRYLVLLPIWDRV
jgi:hypothetical protein